MLDSNGFDALALDDDVLSKVEAAVQRDALALVVTHAEYDEVLNAPAAKRERFLRLALRWTTTAGFVIGVSRLGMANFATNEEVTIYDALAPTIGPRDALVLLTARREGIPVVTGDKGLTKACGRFSVAVLDPEELLRRVSDSGPS